MPAEYKIDKSQRMVFSVAYGIMNELDINSHQEKLRDDPDFDPGFSQLVDCTDLQKPMICLQMESTSWQEDIYSGLNQKERLLLPKSFCTVCFGCFKY